VSLQSLLLPKRLKKVEGYSESPGEQTRLLQIMRKKRRKFMSIYKKEIMIFKLSVGGLTEKQNGQLASEWNRACLAKHGRNGTASWAPLDGKKLLWDRLQNVDGMGDASWRTWWPNKF
jgi:hypothetical protein